jgi:hypothetical protein
MTPPRRRCWLLIQLQLLIFQREDVNSFVNAYVDIFMDLRRCQTLHTFVCQQGTQVGLENFLG